jgi:POT family proton-dependent oligopeptide transporter
MTELWERFTYYGLRALLVLFLVAPLARGGLGLVGVGLLKPNITALVSVASARESMPPDSAFTLFYIGINIGAVGGPLVSAVLAAATGWRGGFAAAACGMLLGLAAFSRVAAEFGGRRVPPKAMGRALWAGVSTLAGLVVVACWWIPVTLLLRAALVLVALTAIMGFIVLIRVAQPGLERRRPSLMMLLFCGATVFWCAEEQAGVSLTLFAERFTDRHVMARDFPAAWYQSLYPLYVVLFAPFFVWGWQRLALLGREPSNILKFAAGLLVAAAGLGVATLAAIRAESAAIVGPVWLAITYLLMALGEILISPVGLAAGTQLSPAGHRGFSTGLWYLSLSLGGLAAGLVGGVFDFSRAHGLASAFGGLGLALAIGGAGFLLIGYRSRIGVQK